MGSVPEGSVSPAPGSLQDHPPTVRLSQERVWRTVAHPFQVQALVSAMVGWVSPLNQPAGRRDPLWADGAAGQTDLPLCQALVDFPGGSDSKESACDAGGLGLIPGSGRNPREGNGNPLRYPGLENPHGQRSLWATVRGVTKSRTRLSN